MVGLQNLDLRIGVRVPASQPTSDRNVDSEVKCCELGMSLDRLD